MDYAAYRKFGDLVAGFSLLNLSCFPLGFLLFEVSTHPPFPPLPPLSVRNLAVHAHSLTTLQTHSREGC